jgi:hypothetical protein
MHRPRPSSFELGLKLYAHQIPDSREVVAFPKALLEEALDLLKVGKAVRF